MTDLHTAKNNLGGHTICLCKGGNCLYSQKCGIAPMMDFIAEGVNLEGYCVADVVVGKAAALLFVKSKLKGVFAKTLSRSAIKVLQEHGIYYEYETLTERIINREGTDVCPMEKAVSFTDDAEEAYLILKEKLQKMRKRRE